MLKMFVVAALMAPLVTHAAVHASERDDAPASRIVRYGDLDLRNADGVRVLERRIAVAARKVCTSEIDWLGVRSVAPKCLRMARAGALPQMLAAVEAARGDLFADGADALGSDVRRR